ncbi:Amidophosphoribosyltransferase, partial [Colletotrichum tanaceti]
FWLTCAAAAAAADAADNASSGNFISPVSFTLTHTPIHKLTLKMCGVSAILLADSKATTAAIDLHESLYLLQHRGQDAAGIAVCQGGRVYHYKGNGMAAKVFADGSSLQHLPGFMGLGHLRYPTMGTSSAYVLFRA